MLSLNIMLNKKHHDQMAGASSHDEQMKYFMQSEILPVVFKPGKLQGVDDAAYGVNDTAGQKESEAYCRQFLK